VLFEPAAPAVRKIKSVQILDGFHLVQQVPDRQFLSHAGRMGPAADQRAGHVCGNDQKLLGEPDVVFLGVSFEIRPDPARLYSQSPFLSCGRYLRLDPCRERRFVPFEPWSCCVWEVTNEGRRARASVCNS
jgi:hypothetical protein